jgi:hypothetical protein
MIHVYRDKRGRNCHTAFSLCRFTSAGQGAAFDRFISQDDYMSGRRGQYSERYGALSPWRKMGYEIYARL